MPLERALRQLSDREAELARVQKIGQIGGLEVDLRGGEFRNVRSPEYLRVHGLPSSAANETHEEWVARIHPDDRDRVVDHFCRSVASRDLEYEVEYRIIRPSDGEVRWIMAKAEIERDSDGQAVRLVGAHIDITARRLAEEQRELISRELSHRIANIFTVVMSMISMSARADPASAKFAQELAGRVGALHRAHGLVVQTAKEEADTLASLLSRLLSPYAAEGTERVAIEGDDVPIAAHAATAVALIVHELATNAVKYGALSEGSGKVRITLTSGADETRLNWTEEGGPRIVKSPNRQGFGSVLVDRAARSQLGAALRFDWRPSGLCVDIAIPAARLTA